MTYGSPILKHSIGGKATFAYALLAIGAITGALFGANANPEWRWLHYLSKPTATALLLFLVLSIAQPQSIRYRNGIALGLVFAIGGDVFLMLPGDYFLAGLICFLLTHFAYIYALLSVNRSIKPMILIVFALIAVLIFAGLWNSLPNGMHIPVAIYAATLAFMAVLAVQNRQRSAVLGGIFFVISDSILAYGRYRFAIPLNPLWVLGTYYIAQWCFARSVLGRNQ